LKKKTGGCGGCLGAILLGVLLIFAVMLFMRGQPSSERGAAGKGLGAQVQKPDELRDAWLEEEKPLTEAEAPPIVRAEEEPRESLPEDEKPRARPSARPILDPEQAVAEAKASLEKIRAQRLSELEARAEYQKAKIDLESTRQRMREASKTDSDADIEAAIRDFIAASSAISDMSMEAANQADVKAAEEKLADALAMRQSMAEAAAEAARRAQEEYDVGGLVLLLNSVQGMRGEFGGEIRGTVINRRDRKLSYVQITFILYDSSGAQVGNALDNIIDLEAGATWRFRASTFGTDFSIYKFSELSGF
jgi:hypothetical protein